MATLKRVEGGLEYTYIEPSTTKTGTPLTDLDHVSIFHDIGAGAVKDVDVPASSPVGGQTITQVIQNPMGQDQEGTITVWSIAIDDDGNEAVKGGEVTLPLDNLAPAPTV